MKANKWAIGAGSVGLPASHYIQMTSETGGHFVFVIMVYTFRLFIQVLITLQSGLFL